jgi:hypothetical protein
MWNPHQTLVAKFGEWFQDGKPPYSGVEVWWMFLIWRCHQTSTSKFGECSDMEMPLNFTCQSLVMDAIHKGKSLVLRNVWCIILGMFVVLNKIWHQSLTNPATSRKQF